MHPRKATASPRSKPARKPVTGTRVTLTIVAAIIFGKCVSLAPWRSWFVGNERPAVLPGHWAHLVIALVVILLLPVAALLLLRSGKSGRQFLDRIRASRAHTTIAVLAVISFLLTLLPERAGGRLMVVNLAVGSAALTFLVAVGYPVLERLLAILRPAWRFLVQGLSPAPFLLLSAGAVFTLANLISWLVFRHIPHVQDSVSQVFQARVFASGRVTLPVRFEDFFFGYGQLINDGSRMYAQYPFGHSLLLALGTLIHAEWLVNPLLGACEIVVLYFLGRELYDEMTGRIVALLGVASPFLLFMSSEYMNHASALLFLSLFLLFFFRAVRPLRRSEASPAPRPSSLAPSSGFADPLLSGLCLAMALNIRPLSALAVSLPIAGYGVYLLLKSRWRTLPAFLLLLVPVLLGIAAYCLYNYLTTGNPLLSGYEADGLLKDCHGGWGPGFGQRGFAALGPYTLLRALIQTGNNLNALNLHLFQSPFPGLLLILLLFLTFTRNPADWALLGAFVALPALYFCYWYQDLCFGPRFLYEAVAPALLLSARGLIEFPRFIRRAVGAAAETRTQNVLAIGMAISLATTAAVGLPRLLRTYGNRYWGVDNRIDAIVKGRGINNAIIFFGSPPSDTFQNYYGAGFLRNKLDFAGPVIYARNGGLANYLLMLRFPNRAYYYADCDTFFRIPDIDRLRNAPPIRDLEQTASFVRETGFPGHRILLLPNREFATVFGGESVPFRTFSEVDYDILRGRFQPSGLMPALAVFMPADQRTYLPLFGPMAGHQSYTSDGYRFTLLFAADNGTYLVYDVRPVGDEGTGRPGG